MSIKTLSKKCGKCHITKNYKEFNKNPSGKHNKSSICKICSRKISLEYSRTEKGVICSFYKDQRKRSKKRNHINPLYSKEELKKWLYKNGFYAMYCQWVWSEYNPMIKPSCDRLENNLCYSLSNIQLVTTLKNIRNYNKKKKVYQFSLDGLFLKEFSSSKSASDKTGIYPKGISNCCIGKQKTAGNYIWSYSNLGR